MENRRQQIDRYLDGNLDTEEIKALFAWVAESPQNAEVFSRQCLMDQQLAELLDSSFVKLLDVEENEEHAVGLPRARHFTSPKIQRRLQITPFTRLAWAIAAVIMVMFSANVYFFFANTERTIAKITGASGPLQWTGNGGTVVHDLAVGSPLGGGTLQSLSADSWGELRFRDGSTLTISGVSTLTLSEHDQKELHLTQGSLSASVTQQRMGKPMLVYTPTAELKVLGTQFNVAAESSATFLTVNEGLVRLKRLFDGEVVEVPAHHQAIASIIEENGLTVTRRNTATNHWLSDLEGDVIYGQWWPDLHALSVKLKIAVKTGELTEEEAKAKYRDAVNLKDEEGILIATPFLVKHLKSDNKPDLLRVVVLSVSHGEAVPVVLVPNNKFRIQGQVKSSTDVTFGVSTNAPSGGFAGKYSVTCKIDVSEPDGNFDVTLPISEFRPVASSEKFSMSPIGKELAEWYCVSKGKDIGLAIKHVELLPPAHDVE